MVDLKESLNGLRRAAATAIRCPPRYLNTPEDSELIGRSSWCSPMEEMTMQLKKTQNTPKYDDHTSLQRAARTPSGERSGPHNFSSTLKSIVSAARLLPAEVDPPVRVWRLLRVQLEKERIISYPVTGRLLKERTRFPMFKN